MTDKQIKNEINYKKSVLVLERLLRFGLVTREQAEKIDLLNRKSFPPLSRRNSIMRCSWRKSGGRNGISQPLQSGQRRKRKAIPRNTYFLIFWPVGNAVSRTGG